MFALSACLVHGQVVTTVGQGQDIFQRNLYSADRVMELRKELELTDAQATKIKKIHSENAGKFSTMKWDLDDATATLKELLDESRIDEVAVQKQMDKVLALENSLKKQQLSTMVSIKNELSFAQQEILQTPNVRTVNGVSISGYGKNSAIPATSVRGNSSNYKVGKPLYGTGTKTTVEVQALNGSGDDAPLYIIVKEGSNVVVPPSEIKEIDPKNIESINVIKDLAAINIYGSRAKNGAIVIKLKEDPKK